MVVESNRDRISPRSGASDVFLFSLAGAGQENKHIIWEIRKYIVFPNHNLEKRTENEKDCAQHS